MKNSLHDVYKTNRKKKQQKKEEITNITTTNGKFNYAYTATQNKGTCCILLTAKEADDLNYCNIKNMSLKVIE